QGDPLPIYECHPPAWVPSTHRVADVGYPGFDPPHPGQEEDVLSDVNIKAGFSQAPYVQSEHAGAVESRFPQESKRSQLFDDDSITVLETIMHEVFCRRTQYAPVVPASTFKIPSRVTLNDTRRQSWFADLANPEVPLHKLGKSVPHGAKGHDLLDLLQSNNVAIPRAVWFLRVFGANETAGLRNKPNFNPTQYSIDWTNVVTGYIRKQLGEITLPSAPRPGLNIKQTFKGFLSEPELRERWVSRFNYCLQLLRPFYAEGLVDRRTFLTWLVQQMSACNLAQAGFVAHLADQYLDDMLSSRALAKPFVDACVAKLTETRTFLPDQLTRLDALLKSLLQRICLTLPDAFVSPHTWANSASFVVPILSNDNSSNTTPGDTRTREAQRVLHHNITDIQRRTDAMLFRNLPPRVLERLGSMVVDIQILNSISSATDMSTVEFFSCNVTDHHPTSTFYNKLDTLLTWSVTPLQFGPHRTYAAVFLLSQYRQRTARREVSLSALQDYLFDWLDTSEVAAESGNIRSVSALFGKLVKDGLFDYASYLQRLVARGEESLSYAQSAVSGSKHREFLRWIPLHNTTSSLSHQRKVILHGARVRETPEDLCERAMRREIRTVIPLVFGGSTTPFSPPTISALRESCSTTIQAPRFEQVKMFKQWLLPNYNKFAAVSDAYDESAVLQTYSIVAELLSCTNCYGSLLELSLSVLSQTSNSQIIEVVGEVFHRFATVWTSMGCTGAIATALYSAHVGWKNRGMRVRSLLALLIQMDAGRHLDESERAQITADISSFTLALAPDTTDPGHVPEHLPEILLLADDPKPDAPSILANGLWYKYRTALDWGWKVWDNTIASLRQVPLMTADINRRHAIALQYAQFLLHVDQHLPAGIDDHVLQWSLGTGRGEILALTVDAWDVCFVVLLFLSAHGALSTTSLLRGLVYPAWHICANATGYSTQLPTIFVQSANELFDRLILHEEIQISSTAPSSLLDTHRIHSRRQNVFREPYFPQLVEEMPTLVLIECNEIIPLELRAMAKDLRVRTCESREFRQAAYRDLGVIRKAFEQPIQSGSIGEALFEPLVNALKVILSDSSEGTDVNAFLTSRSPSELSPWRLAATAVQLQFGLRQLGRAMAHDATKQAASASLDKMTSRLFHHSMASDEAYFIAQTARDIDGPVAEKFFNNGFKSIVDIFTRAPFPALRDTLFDRVGRAGELLRVLSHVAEPLRTKGVVLHLDPLVQERLSKVILETLITIETMLSKSTNTSHEVKRCAIFLARLLQFNLGFIGPWSTSCMEIHEGLMAVLFRLLLIYAAGAHFDPVAFSLLADTLYFVIDGKLLCQSLQIFASRPEELNSHSKSGTPDLFRFYPKHLDSELPSGVPAEFYAQLCSLLPQLPPNEVVKGLVHAYRDPSGQLAYGTSVQNRPWEWIENLGEPSAETGLRPRTDSTIKNATSLSLEFFAARPTGDHILQTSVWGPSEDVPDLENMRLEGDLRAFEDGLSAESVYARDWRETRLEAHRDIHAGVTENTGGDGNDDLGVLAIPPAQIHSVSRRPSPASSVRSRDSAHGSIASLRQSPGMGAKAPLSALSETMEDAEASTTEVGVIGHKRKAETDDEVEIIEGPIPDKARKAKAVKPRPKRK
ncbi:hypothetical protein EDD17DRAFT_1784529, partial [Pisolithus thermaeus]